MSSPAVTVQFPDNIYESLQTRAAESQRTLQEELVHVVSLIVPGDDKIAADLERELASLTELNDQQLWDAANVRVASDIQERLEDLADFRQERRLTEQELQEQAKLLHECHRVMLTRAYAAVALKQRGFDISSLGPEQ